MDQKFFDVISNLADDMKPLCYCMFPIPFHLIEHVSGEQKHAFYGN